MGHTYTDLLYHVTFSTKERIAQIVAEIRPRLLAYMGGVVREMGGEAILINGTPDHVHLLLHLPPTLPLSNVERDVKANSSGWVHEQWKHHAHFAWQTGYGGFTVSESKRESTRRYIESQERHHATVSFQEEFLALLKKHGIQYDERYIWD